MYSKLFPPQRLLGKVKNKPWASFARASSSSSSEEKIIKSPAPFLELPKGNFAKTVLKNIDTHWMKPAIECSKTGQQFTYSEMVEQTARWTEFLKQMGVGLGDTISVISPNCIQYPPIFLGIAASGAAFSPINARFTPDEIRKMITMSKPRIIIYLKELEPIIAKALRVNIKDYQFFSIGKSQELGAKNIDDILYDKQKSPPFNPVELVGDEILYIPYSSGTTGAPKAVTTNHNALASNILIYTNPYHDVYWEPEGTSQKIQVAMLPFFHIYGLLAVLSCGVYSGVKTVIISNFTPEGFISALIKHKINYVHTVPTLLNLLNYSPQCTSETIGNINSVICGAAPVLQSSVNFFKKKMKKEILFYEGFGMTEVGITSMMPRRFQNTAGCGRLMSNVEAKVINTETGASLGPNELGEICFRSPAAMVEYLDNPSATSEFFRNGWGHSGDLGYYDENEFFHIVDRTKDLIKVHGLQVSPTEIEEELQKHPSVAECSVIGIPDDRSGEAPFAFVILKKEASENELQSFLTDKLAKHKQLRRGIKFVDTLPKSDTGKVLRRKLKSML